MSESTTKTYCPQCEHELDKYGHCPKHWPPSYKTITKNREHQVVNRLAVKTPIADDLLTIIESHSPLSTTITRLLDALSALVETTSAGKAKNLEQSRHRPQHAPIPHPQPAWVAQVETETDNRLWELTTELESFLNRPTDPKQWAQCDTCGNKRLGESSYCHNCGTRILVGARRCRLPGCPNEGRRRADCPNIPH